MDDFVVWCPRCKQTFSSGKADQLADALIAHAEDDTGMPHPANTSLHESSGTTRRGERGE